MYIHVHTCTTCTSLPAQADAQIHCTYTCRPKVFSMIVGILHEKDIFFRISYQGYREKPNVICNLNSIRTKEFGGLLWI